MIKLPTATYRLQLRGGVTFADIEKHLTYFRDLGISHLYLSPPFTAVRGSTHGYDIVLPTQIEPELGGRAGFSQLAAAAKAHGLGIVIDIVPNHMAFSVENPWLCDVLRHGPESRYGQHFDIDWAAGKLVLPFLDEPLEAVLQAGRIAIEADADGPVLTEGSIRVPLNPLTMPATLARDEPDALRAILQAQHWKLVHWENERDGITHRRFFNVTGLIGLRVEDQVVFDETHSLIFDLVASGEVQGLRVDHVDGLADPAAYLDRLRQGVGDATPIWVEKILTGDESLPDWPVQGTTGYEAARAIARVLTDSGGLARLDEAWRGHTGQQGDFHTALISAKTEVMLHDLAAELHQLIGLARQALSGAEDADAGDEALREALLALLYAFPCYRTYFSPTVHRPDDARMMQAVRDAAGSGLRSDRVVHALTDRIMHPQTASSIALQSRFQQVTGALLAKSHEDTAGFRWNCYLAANEVGSDPDAATMSMGAFNQWMDQRLSAMPGGLTLTSSHDTKRSEDARMRLVALSHLPEAFLALWRATQTVDGSASIDPNLAWYILQTVVAAWEPGRADVEDRVAGHVEKAMREAKLVTTWSHPDGDAEQQGMMFARQIVRLWSGSVPDEAQKLILLARRLSLTQTVLKFAMPGIPDVYQGTETAAFYLTDPDNRLAVDFKRLGGADLLDGFDGLKAGLTKRLLHLRARHPSFFATASVALQSLGPDGMTIIRKTDVNHLTIRVTRLSINIEAVIGGVVDRSVLDLADLGRG